MDSFGDVAHVPAVQSFISRVWWHIRRLWLIAAPAWPFQSSLSVRRLYFSVVTL